MSFLRFEASQDPLGIVEQLLNVLVSLGRLPTGDMTALQVPKSLEELSRGAHRKKR